MAKAKKTLKKLWKNTKGVVSVARSGLKTELKGSGKILGKTLRKRTGFKKIKRRKKSLKELSKGFKPLGLNTKILYD